MAFKRKIQLAVGEKDNENLIITNLRIDFEIEKLQSDGVEENTAKVSVYNCNEETAVQLCQAGNHVILKVGYEDEIIGTIFTGTIIIGEKKRDGVDSIVEMQLADGRDEVISSFVSLSYAKNTAYITVVKALTNAIGLPVKGIEKVQSSYKFQHGYSFIGMAGDSLRTVLWKMGLVYFIQNEMLYIAKPNESVELFEIVLKPSTGLITIPSHVSDKKNPETIEDYDLNRWKFTTLLFPQLMPGAKCKVESSTLNGEVVIDKATFKGSNYEGDFIIEIEAIEET